MIQYQFHTKEREHNYSSEKCLFERSSQYAIHAIPLFVSANVLPLNMLYFETVCSLMHDISTNSAPQNICDVFTCSSDVHTYNTRFSDAGNLYVNKSRLRIQLNSFSIFGAKLWNCLKANLRKLRKKPFKNKIHQFYLRYLVMRMIMLMSLR